MIPWLVDFSAVIVVEDKSSGCSLCRSETYRNGRKVTAAVRTHVSAEKALFVELDRERR
jgi:hypothetical protein